MGGWIRIWEFLGTYSYLQAPETGPSTVLKMTVPSTTEEKICKKNDVKARSLLLMALPNEHQLTFNQYADAQSMFCIKAALRKCQLQRRQKGISEAQYEKLQCYKSDSLDLSLTGFKKLVRRLGNFGVDTFQRI
ncbi:hypothetical protein Tco_0715454 [Tanacetum coccineum]